MAFTKSDAEARLGHVFDPLARSVRDGFEKTNQVVGLLGPVRKIPLRGLMWNNVTKAAAVHLEPFGARYSEARERFWLTLDEIIIRFKKFDGQLRTRANATQTEFDYECQRQLELVPRGPHLNLGWTLNWHETEITGIYLTMPRRRETAWAIDLTDFGGDTTLPIPTPPVPRPVLRPRIRRDDAEAEGTS